MYLIQLFCVLDVLIEEYLRLASSFSADEINELTTRVQEGNAMDVKLRLAFDIVKTYHSSEAADGALDYFNKQFRSKSLEDQVYEDVTVEQGDSLSDVLVKQGVVDSYSKARRLFQQGGVRVEGEKISFEQSQALTSLNGLKIRVGKKNFFKINQ